ncbi:MAG: type II secretion system minor pseudopilin GspK [Nitrospirota bacterium]
MMRSERGFVLVAVLGVLALITALVTEFAYGVFVNTSLLSNWQTSQRLSVAVNSGASIAARLINEEIRKKSYTYPGTVNLPPYDVGDGLFASVSIEDENSKFNLNDLVDPNGTANKKYVESFARLLGALELDENLAWALADWMDADEVPLISGGEEGAKNAPFSSVRELRLVPGMDEETYKVLLPHVTIYGKKGFTKAQVNINGASVPVLMSISPDITEDMAKRIVGYREVTPFKAVADLQKVAGFETLSIALTGRITVRGEAFRVTVTAASGDGLLRTVEFVMDRSGLVKYWEES